MNKKKYTFGKIASYSIYKYRKMFDLFDVSLGKVIVYFLFLNLFMFLPITYSLMNIEDLDVSRIGITIEENPPSFIPNGLPTDCMISNQILHCGSINEYEYTITNRDQEYTVILNAFNKENYQQNNTIIFYREGFDIRFSGGSYLEFTYIGFNHTEFADLHDMTQEQAMDVIMSGILGSVKPVVFLPILLMVTGALLLANTVLLIFLAALSMLFKFTTSDFPSYKNMLKLYVYASTTPAIINVIIGFLGYSVFTTIVYNILTPIIVFIMYKRSVFERNTRV